MADKFLALDGVKVILDIVDEKDAVVKQSIPTDNNQLSNGAGFITVEALSEYAKKSEIPQEAIPYDDTEIKKRIDALEKKEDKDTVYDDTELRGRIETLEGKEEYDDSSIKQRLTALEEKEDKDTVYDDAEIKKQLQELNSKVEDIEIPSVDGLASKEWVLQQEYMTNDDLDGYMGDINDSLGELKEAVKNTYDDSELRGRIETLEKKEDKDTVYDDTDIKQRLTTLEQKEDKDTVYDDTELKNRIVALEGKESYDDSELRGRIEALEGKEEYDDTELSNRVSTLEAIDHSQFASKDEIPQMVYITQSEYDGLGENVKPNVLYLIPIE